MAKTKEEVLNELFPEDTEITMEELLTKLKEHTTLTEKELRLMISTSVQPLPNVVKNQAEELKARMINIVTDEEKGATAVIDKRMVLIDELITRLSNNLKENYYTKEQVDNELEDKLNLENYYEKDEVFNKIEISESLLKLNSKFNDYYTSTLTDKKIKEYANMLIDSKVRIYNLETNALSENDFPVKDSIIEVLELAVNGVFLMVKFSCNLFSKPLYLYFDKYEIEGNWFIYKFANKDYELIIEKFVKDEEYELYGSIRKIPEYRTVEDSYSKQDIDDEFANIKELFLGDNVDELYDTFTEIANYITEDKSGAKALLDRIDTLENETYRKNEIYNKNETNDKLTLKADKIDTFTKLEVNNVIQNKLAEYYDKDSIDDKLSNLKIDMTDYYTKAEVDEIITNIDGDINLSGYYSKQEVDDKLLLKADVKTTYTKTEVDSNIKKVNDKVEGILFNAPENYNSFSQVAVYIESNELDKNATNKRLDNIEADIKTNISDIEKIEKRLEDIDDYEVRISANEINIQTNTDAIKNKANLNDVYTKIEIEDKLDDIIAGGIELNNYYTKEETDGKLKGINDTLEYISSGVTSEYDNLAKIQNKLITNGTDINILKEEIKEKANSNNVYTKTEVDNLVLEKTDMTNYYTKDELYNKTIIDTYFYTKSDINNSFYTKDYIDANFYTKNEAIQNFLTSTQMQTYIAENYYNKDEINSIVFDDGKVLFYTKEESDSMFAERDTKIEEIKTTVTTLIGNAPEAYDTLAEIATYIASDKNGASSMLASIKTNASAIETNKTDIKTLESELENLDTTKANLSDVYTKTQVDSKLDEITSGGISLNNYYTKTETDTKLVDYVKTYDIMTKIKSNGSYLQDKALKVGYVSNYFDFVRLNGEENLSMAVGSRVGILNENSFQVSSFNISTLTKNNGLYETEIDGVEFKPLGGTSRLGAPLYPFTEAYIKNLLRMEANAKIGSSDTSYTTVDNMVATCNSGITSSKISKYDEMLENYLNKTNGNANDSLTINGTENTNGNPITKLVFKAMKTLVKPQSMIQAQVLTNEANLTYGAHDLDINTEGGNVTIGASTSSISLKGNTTAPKFITSGGTNEQVVLGDGSLMNINEISGSVDLSDYATQEWVENKNYLTEVPSSIAKNFTINGNSGDTSLTVKSNSVSSYIGFSGTSGNLGYYGYSSSNTPIVYLSSGVKKIIHEGNYSDYVLGKSDVSVIQNQTSGIEIASVTVGSTTTKIYAPTAEDVDLTDYYTKTETDNLLENKLNTNGGNITGHIYLTGSKASSSTGNTSQIVFGTSSTQHVALSSNDNTLVINPTTTTTTNQIVLYLDKQSQFPSGITSSGTINAKTLQENGTSLSNKYQTALGYTPVNKAGDTVGNLKAEVNGMTNLGATDAKFNTIYGIYLNNGTRDITIGDLLEKDQVSYTDNITSAYGTAIGTLNVGSNGTTLYTAKLYEYTFNCDWLDTNDDSMGYFVFSIPAYALMFSVGSYMIGSTGFTATVKTLKNFFTKYSQINRPSCQQASGEITTSDGTLNVFGVCYLASWDDIAVITNYDGVDYNYYRISNTTNLDGHVYKITTTRREIN